MAAINNATFTKTVVSIILYFFCICLTPLRHNLGHIEAVLLDRLSAATHEILG